MNNASFYASPAVIGTLTTAVTGPQQANAAAHLLHKAYNRYVKYISSCGCNFADMTLDMAAYAIRTCDTAFVYDIGEIVQVVRDDGIPHYGTVKRYIKSPSNGAYNAIEVVSDDPKAKGNWAVTETSPARYKAHIPEGLLSLVRSQLQATCPLKEATCR